ncbi:MAG: ATP-dependent DNA helicase RecG [Burkholderiales bacterium]|nr:ATP-dependent DNA helicase RecG [Burkholderiales bacterium]
MPPPSAAQTPDSPAKKPASSGPQRAMERLGLRRPIDLALHLPLRYEDETRLTRLREAQPGETVQVEGVVTQCRVEQTRRRQLLVSLRDEDGQSLLLRFLHFYPSQQKAMAEGRRLRVRGELRGGLFGREMVHPVVKDAEAPLAQALTPVYPAGAGLPQAYLRKAIAAALPRAPLHELLPPDCLPDGLPGLRDALNYLHHPPPAASLKALLEHHHPAWQRLKFEELLAQQLSQLEAKQLRAQHRAPALRGGALVQQLLATLPFLLTGAQRRVGEEIAADLAQAQPAHRLLQGDVGSGKTVVAALAAAVCIDAGWQCALMAPTELLAEQHLRKLVGWLEPLGVRVAWITGSVKGKARARLLEQAASGEAQLVVGTHALIESQVQFRQLGLAVVDEQHRFGVAQRLALRKKLAERGLEPHLLMMSATPIPRTLAMSYYADLDVSTLDELPPGRTPIVTKLFELSKREAVVERIAQETQAGRQAYWVCPLIEDSEESDLKAATATHAELAERLGAERVGLLHGRLKPAEKAAVMQRFASGELPLLVATTVIEVGVDVPNASLMVIEHAERFGLAQLHQLRGRVGRGAAASVCVLLYAGPLSESGRERMKAMLETSDGFEIARRDLAIRGPGEFMGHRQSGADLLRFADLQEDAPLLVAAREIAPRLLREHPAAAHAQVQRWLGTKAELLKA